METKTIVLIEDDPKDIKMTQKAFAKSVVENQLVIFTDGKTALKYLFDLGIKELPVLILLDLNMYGMHGFEVLKELKQNETTKKIPVVVLTASKDEIVMDYAIAGGASGFVSKPVNFDEFSDVVRTVGLYWYKAARTLKDVAIFLIEKAVK